MSIKEIIERVKQFFERLLGSHKNLMLNKAQENNYPPVEKQDQIEKESIINTLRMENKKNQTMSDIINITEKNPQVLEHLDPIKLEVINDYYRKENSELNEKIKKENQKLKELNDAIKFLNEQLKIIKSQTNGVNS